MFMDLEIWSSVSKVCSALFFFSLSPGQAEARKPGTKQQTAAVIGAILILGCREAVSVIRYEFHNCSSSIQAVHIL